jgi:hypothetical protein
MEMARPMEMPEVKEVTDALAAFQSAPAPAFSDELKPSAQDWLDALIINHLVERAPTKAPLRLLFQQLAEVVRQEAEEIRSVLDQFKEGLEQLILEPP